MEEGMIETRSGNWQWSIMEIRPWPRSAVTERRLAFEDPVNPINRMSVGLGLDCDDFSSEAIQRFSREPKKRRFEDQSGNIWIAYLLRGRFVKGIEQGRQISLRRLGQESRVANLPDGMTLGDLRHDELLALVGTTLRVSGG